MSKKPKKNISEQDDSVESKANNKTDDKYVRILASAKSTEFKIIGDRVLNGELKMSHYTIENFVGVFYYLIIKK